MALRISGNEHLWPDGVIPYEIDSNDYPPGSSGRAVILTAIGEWNTKTNITFIPRMSDPDYVVFRFGVAEAASDSPAGRVGGAQAVRGATDGVNRGGSLHDTGAHTQCEDSR